MTHDPRPTVTTSWNQWTNPVVPCRSLSLPPSQTTIGLTSMEMVVNGVPWKQSTSWDIPHPIKIYSSGNTIGSCSWFMVNAVWTAITIPLVHLVGTLVTISRTYVIITFKLINFWQERSLTRHWRREGACNAAQPSELSQFLKKMRVDIDAKLKH